MAKFELDKDVQKVKFVLEKKKISSITAEVVAAIDCSGSMQTLFKRGAVQEALQRVVPVALNFDDNGDIPTYGWDYVSYRTNTDLTKDNYQNYVKDYMKPQWGGTCLTPVITDIVKDLGFIQTSQTSSGGFLGFGKKTTTTNSLTQTSKTGLPAIIYILTDGQNSDERDTRDILTKLSESNSQVYFNFIGIGDVSFDFLEQVADDLPNVNFVQIRDIVAVGASDDIYNYLLPDELTTWLRKYVK